mmetsp:Transcript_14667/g.28208  ORF Transcript_14667/g.28208 Transcript_14667/m.28208 type:complete len:230 (-) Transcript_14667:30-719(-)
MILKHHSDVFRQLAIAIEGSTLLLRSNRLLRTGCLALLTTGKLALTGCLGTSAAGFELVGKGFLASLFGLCLVDRLHEHALVLEHVTLYLHVHLVVHMLVNLLRIPVLLQQSAKHSQATHPQDLRRQARFARSLALTVASVAPLAFCLKSLPCASTRVNLGGLADHEAVLHQLTDVLARVRHADFVHLIGIQPDFTLPALKHRSGQPLLQLQRHHLHKTRKDLASPSKP